MRLEASNGAFGGFKRVEWRLLCFAFFSSFFFLYSLFLIQMIQIIQIYLKLLSRVPRVRGTRWGFRKHLYHLYLYCRRLLPKPYHAEFLLWGLWACWDFPFCLFCSSSAIAVNCFCLTVQRYIKNGKRPKNFRRKNELSSTFFPKCAVVSEFFRIFAVESKKYKKR